MQVMCLAQQVRKRAAAAERIKPGIADHRGVAEKAIVCRYCGLLQPALAAHNEARRLDPQSATTVNHTNFML